jgi:hypothetical protein
MFLNFIMSSLRFLRGEFSFRGVLTTLIFLLLLGTLPAQPRVEIKENKQSFGSVKRGELVELKYELKNTGNSALLLLASEVSCSCTLVEFSKEPVAPGKSTTVVVKFDTKSVWGRQDRYVYISCNDPKGEIALRYKGQVSKE